MKPTRSKLISLFILVILLAASFAPAAPVRSETLAAGLHPMPPHRSLLEKMLREGRTLPSTEEKWARGIDRPSQFPNPPSGSFNMLVVQVDFSDKPNSGLPPVFFDNLVFTRPGPAFGSVAEYFFQVSYGTLTLVTVNLPGALGWQRPPKPYNGGTGYINADTITPSPDDYGWGAYPQNLQGIVADTLPLIDPVVNFSNYDNDSDGFVESVVFIHAGSGAEWTGSPNDIWSSAWNMSTGTNNPGPWLSPQDGVYVDNFLFVPEFWAAAGDMTIGVYCHELGHSLFGLPDLYDLTGSPPSWGVGDWSLMGTGGWNGPTGWGDSPAWPDAWSRMVMGFEFPMPIDGDVTNFFFPPIETGPALTVMLRNSQLGPREYFLLENRQLMGFDTFLPGTGLLIWHIDEDKWNIWEGNNSECTVTPCCTAPCNTWHFLAALEQADGNLDLENRVTSIPPATLYYPRAGDLGDPFPGSTNNTSFKVGTNPESGSYYASPCPSNSCIEVNNITSIGPPPNLIQADLKTVCKTAGGCVNIVPPNQMGWDQPGTDAAYRVSIQNCSTAADTLDISISSLWPSTLYDLGTKQPLTQTALPAGGVQHAGITITVPTDAIWGDTDVFSMTVKPQSNPAIEQTALITTSVPHCTLVVDDDRSNPDVEIAYTKALTNGNYAFDYWDANLLDPPDLATLAAHPSVIWFTGTPRFDTLHHRDEIALGHYLESGGQLFLSSQDYLYDAGRTPFSLEYLRVFQYISDVGPTTGFQTSQVVGAPGNPVGNGLGPFLLNPPAPLADWTWNLPSDIMSLAFLDDQNGLYYPNGLTYNSGVWKTAFLAWPFENLLPPDTDAVMASAMNWFGVPPQPQAAFTPSTSPACVGDIVTFNNTSLDATAAFWDFGDGATSTVISPTHIYTAPMSANVELIAANCCGGDMDSQTLDVYYAPTAGFTASPTVALVGDTIVFSNTSTNASSYIWDFDDGNTSSDANPSHIYSAAIDATVVLTASSGCRSEVFTRTVSVYAAPVAGFTPSASVVSVGDPVNFTNTSANASAYQWDFGDGVGASTLANPTYAYTQTGTYTVTLQASNPAASDTEKQTIQVTKAKEYLYLPTVMRVSKNSALAPLSWIDWLRSLAIALVSLAIFSLARKHLR